MVSAVFMGTPRFALPSLRALTELARVQAVVTQPARPAGRGRRPRPSPVAREAERLGLPLLAPEKLGEARAALEALRPELVLLVAYGRWVPPWLLELPAHGALNVHPSLLPRYRGPAPIPFAILEGERVTGVTLMVMVAEMDAGPIVAQESTPIGPQETALELEERLAELAARLVRQALPRWLAGELQAAPQDEGQATVTRLLRKEDGRLDWSRPAEQLARQVRALAGWPGAFTRWEGRQLNVWRAEAPPGQVGPAQAEPGRVLPGLLVATGGGVLRLLEVQLEGRRRLSAAEFLRGHPGIVGARLGEDRATGGG